MNNNRIVFLCHFSNPFVRNYLGLKRLYIWNCLAKAMHRGISRYDDFAIWVSDYINEFEKHPEYEFHVVSPHKGMIKKREDFDDRSIHYHFFKCDKNSVLDYVNVKFHLEERNNYRRNRKIIQEIINEIQPGIIIMCGAENPYYSTSVFDVKDIPVYVILQTLLNDQKRIEMGVGSSYRRKVELDIFRQVRYFCTTGENAIKKIKEVNRDAVILPVRFPTHRPIITIPKKKTCDFVFFSRIITENKGIKDILHALAIVKKTYVNVRLDVIGGCGIGYRKKLECIVEELALQNNVNFIGYYDTINDTYNHVARAKAAVLPGITAGLNSTVRESMLMGLPTICYASAATDCINLEKSCIMAAKMEDTDDLARQMLFVLDNPEKAEVIAKDGMDYANRVFSNEAIVNELLDNCGKIINKVI